MSVAVVAIKIGNGADVEPVAASFADHPYRQVMLVGNRKDDFVHKFAARDPGKVFHPAEHIARHYSVSSRKPTTVRRSMCSRSSIAANLRPMGPAPTIRTFCPLARAIRRAAVLCCHPLHPE